MSIHITKSKFSAILLCLYSIFIAIGVYYSINVIIMTIFLLLTFFLVINSKSFYINEYTKSSFRKTWLLYMCIEIFSLFINHRTAQIDWIVIQLIHVFIIYELLSIADKDKYFIYQRNTLIFIAVITLIDYFCHLGIFDFIKSGSGRGAIDMDGGLCSIFEYRHYYGLFLIYGFIIMDYYPLKNKKWNITIKALLLLNIVLTLTRNTWLSILLYFFCKIVKRIYQWIVKNKTIKLSFKDIIGFILLFSAILILIIYNLKMFTALIEKLQERTNMSYFTRSGVGVRGYTLTHGLTYFFDNIKTLFAVGGGPNTAIEWLTAHPYGFSRWTAAIDIQYVSTLIDFGVLGLLSLIAVFFRGYKNFFIICGNSKSNFIEKRNVSATKYTGIQSGMIICLSLALTFFDIIGTNVSPFIVFLIIVLL